MDLRFKRVRNPYTNRLITVGSRTYNRIIRKGEVRVLPSGYLRVITYKTSMRDAFRGFTVRKQFVPTSLSKHYLPDEWLDQIRTELLEFINDELIKKEGIKLFITLKAVFQRDRDGATKVFDFRQRSRIILLLEDNLEERIDDMLQQLIDRIQTDTNKEGSGWTFKSIDSLDVNLTEFNPLAGASYCELPIYLKKNNSIINPKNLNDNECFKWAILIGLHATKTHSNNVNNYIPFIKNYNWNKIKYPADEVDYRQFEKNNPDICLYVWTHKWKNMENDDLEEEEHIKGKLKMSILYHSKNNKHDDTRPIVNLLLVNNHYVCITKLSGLLRERIANHLKRHKFCYKCLRYYDNEVRYRRHYNFCLGDGITEDVMPLPGEKIFFKDHYATLMKPFIIISDYEALLAAVDADKTGTYKVKEHKQTTYAMVTQSIYPELDGIVRTYCGTDIGNKFFLDLLELYQIYRDAYKKKYVKTREYNFKQCYLCKSKKDIVIFPDGDPIKGEINGYACKHCFAKRQNAKDTVNVYFHNGKNYDFHYILENIGKFSNRLNCIAQTSEKFMQIRADKFVFNDSYQMFSAGLDKLAKCVSNFRYVDQHFKGKNVEDLKVKLPYPYEYMDSWEKYDETRLPPVEYFENEEKYEQALAIWNKYECNTLKDFTILYCLIDVLLLSDIMWTFRQSGMDFSGLDPAYYMTTPSYTWACALKKTDISIPLTSKYEIYCDDEKAIRGGVSTIIKRFTEKAENKHVLYVDFNNLYGAAMMQPLPYTENIVLDTIPDWKNTPDDNPIGYRLIIDCMIPEELHDKFNDFPLAPEHLEVNEDMISEFNKEYLIENNLKFFKGKKLIPNLLNKTYYNIDFRLLKYFVDLGLVVTKIHKVYYYHQRPWLKEYITELSEKRRQAKINKNDFLKEFYKLLANAVYGKFVENIRKRRNVTLVNSEEKMKRKVTNPRYDGHTIINENLVVVDMKKSVNKLCKPIYIGACILDLSKLIVYKGYYESIKKQFGDRCHLVFTDTDSFILEIYSDDLYSELKELSELFDFSNFSKDHPLYSTHNEMVPGKLKIEHPEEIIKEFVGLRSKMYSLKFENDQEENKAKGIKANSFKANNINHEKYKSVLFGSEKVLDNKVTFETFNSKIHQIGTYNVTKIGLSAYDDKRYILDNGIDTLAYGHFQIKNF